jgi:hypothetical protein
VVPACQRQSAPAHSHLSLSTPTPLARVPLSLPHDPRSSAWLPVRLSALADPWVLPVGTVPTRIASALRCGHAHDRAFSGHAPRAQAFSGPAHTHSPFPAQLCTQPSTLALSLALSARPGSSAAAHNSPPLVLRPQLSLCRARYLGEFCLFASNVGNPPVCPQPLWFARSMLNGVLPVQPKPRHRRPEASQRPRRRSSTRHEQPPCPYFPSFCSVVRVIAHRSKFVPPLGRSATVCTL